MKNNDSQKRGRPRWLLHTTLILFICIYFVPCTIAAQSDNHRITLEMNAATIPEVFEAIRQQIGMGIMFSSEDSKRIPKKNYQIRNASVEQAMELILQGTDLEYNISNGVILVSRKEEPARQQQQQQPQSVATGRVTDSAGEPIIGASVYIKGTTFGTTTDADGRFSLSVARGEVLVFSFIGMETMEAAYTGQSELKITLKETVQDLAAVVVTGIFNKAKESYTGAATTISRKDLAMAGNRNLLTSIQNIDPSFFIADDLDIGSDPNALPDITIRGNASLGNSISEVQSSMQNRSNQPLFILDGFEITLTRMLDLDQNIIDRITILKDASATAMYGTRGANGVVVITTVKPEEGQLRMTYKGSLNLEAPMLGSYNLMNAREKLDFEYEAGLYSTNLPGNQIILQKLYNQRRSEVERGVDTYWLKYPVRTGVGSRHSLRIDGGREEILYAANLSYDNIAGAMKGSYRNTFNGDLFLSYAYKNIRFQNNLIISFNQSANSPYGKFREYGVINSYLKPYDDQGNLLKVLTSQDYSISQGNNVGAVVMNPLWNAKQPNHDESKYTQIQNNFEINWDIIPRELFVRARFGYTHTDTRSDVYNSAEHTKFEGYTGENLGRRGEYILSSNTRRLMETSISLNYSKVFDDVHQLYAGLNGSFSNTKEEYFRIKAEGITNPDMNFLGAATLYEKGGRPYATEGHSRRIGGTLNANYTYDRRYFVDVTTTIEGSSLFGVDNQFAPFWSTGIGWNMHAESFMQELDAISIARLRLSFGTSGSQNFSPYQALATFASYGDTHYNGWYGVYLVGMENKDLGWQKTHSLNVGLDVEFFNRRIVLSADVYNKLSKDVLADVALPLAAGFASYKANIGELENKGVEVGLNVVPVRDMERQIRWSVGGTLRHNKNTIKKISNALETLNNEMLESDGVNPSFLFREGHSINTIFAVQSIGIDPSSGKELFIDRSGNMTDVWDPRDKIPCGVSDPKVFGTFNTNFSWRRVTFSAVFSYRMGGDYYNQTLANKVENIYPFENADKRAYYDRWKKTGDDVMFKSIKGRSETYATSRFVMKENTLQCNSMSLQYEMEAEWLKRNLNISYLSIAAYTEDVFRISTIKRERGLDYPFSKKFSLSLTARF